MKNCPALSLHIMTNESEYGGGSNQTQGMSPRPSQKSASEIFAPKAVSC